MKKGSSTNTKAVLSHNSEAHVYSNSQFFLAFLVQMFFPLDVAHWQGKSFCFLCVHTCKVMCLLKHNSLYVGEACKSLMDNRWLSDIFQSRFCLVRTSFSTSGLYSMH